MTASENNLRIAFSVDTGKYPGMDDQELFDIRHFSVHEEMSGLFEVSVVAVVEEPNIPLQAFVGRAVALRIQTPNPGASQPVRVWAGVCAHMSHLHGADAGVSAYHVSIVPMLWRTTLRKNSRIFQHVSTVDIVKSILAEWKITAKWQLAATYNAHEYCVQYGETDFAFISRLLEDAGISYYFEFNAGSGKGNDIVTLAFDDAPQTVRKTNTRSGSLAYGGIQTPPFGSTPDFCTNVSINQRVSPGRVVLRDFDFRLPPTLNLSSQATLANNPEAAYEQFEYSPGEFLWEPGKDTEGIKAVADQYSGGKPARSVADNDKMNQAQIALDAERRRQITVGFHTNAIDLRPGLIVGINQESTTTPNHPRTDLAPDQKLLITNTHLEGEHVGEWSMTATASYAAVTLRPERRTLKPRIHGVQSAIVVGPKGHEIYTDEFGRVRVQFHWDREGKYDDKSSCWMRVSQAWAGGGFGMITIPRVGHEVLVQFFEGDPDLPVIVGRVHNLYSPVPYALPDNQTVSGIKSNSSMGGGGFNEIKFDDMAGSELIHVQAQNALSTVVNGSESRDIGGARTTSIHLTETINVEQSRSVNVGTEEMTSAGSKHTIAVGKNKTGSIITDQKIIFSTGLASITLDGEDIHLSATGMIHLHAGKDSEFTVASGTLKIQGGSDVRINDKSNGDAPQLDAVVAAVPPTPPGKGGAGTPPNLPSGGLSIPKPGPLSGDVNVQLPDNAVEESSTSSPTQAATSATSAAAKGVTGATGALGTAAGGAAGAASSAAGALGSAAKSVTSGPLGAISKLADGALQSAGKSMLTTVATDVVTGNLKNLSVKGLEQTALGDVKADAVSSAVSAVTKNIKLPGALGGLTSGGAKTATSAAPGTTPPATTPPTDPDPDDD